MQSQEQDVMAYNANLRTEIKTRVSVHLRPALKICYHQKCDV